MNEVTLKINTWGCGLCGYSQNFDPADATLWELHINQDATITSKRGLVPQGCCPACYTGMNKERVVRDNCSLDGVVDLSSLSTTTTASDSELESRKEVELDSNGDIVMIQTGERQRLSIVKGAPAVITEPIFEPKQRELTTKELSALKLERDSNLDSLEAVAVKEVTQTKEELK